MKLQCPHCKALLNTDVQEFLKVEEMVCVFCGTTIPLKNGQEMKISFQFVLTDLSTSSEEFVEELQENENRGMFSAKI